MMRDPHVRVSIEANLTPLSAATWDVSPASDEPLDLEVADFVRYSMLERLDFLSFVRTAVCDALRDGVSCWEFSDDARPIPRRRFPLHPGAGQGVVYTGVHHRPRFSIDRWIQAADDPANIDGFVQILPGSDTEPGGEREARISQGALVWRLTFDQQSCHFDGFPALRSAWGAFEKKRLLEILEGIFHERQSVGTPTLTIPKDASKEDRELATQQLRDWRSHESSYMLLLEGWKFEIAVAMSQPTGIRQSIDAAVRDIAHNLNAAFMLLGSPGTSGSFALAQTQYGQFALSAETRTHQLEYGLNVGLDGWSPVERLVRLNYGADVELPRLVARNLPTKDFTAWFGVLPNLVSAKIITPDEKLEAYVRQAGSLPPRDPASAREAPTVPITPAPAAPAEPPAEPAQDGGEEGRAP